MLGFAVIAIVTTTKIQENPAYQGEKNASNASHRNCGGFGCSCTDFVSMQQFI
jgi:hypothetical protein